jgi:hypothetical protein
MDLKNDTIIQALKGEMNWNKCKQGRKSIF